MEKNKLREKRMRKIKNVFEEIAQNYPELTVSSGGKNIHPIEQVKAYHEIKNIEFQKKQSFALNILTALIVILTALSIFNIYYCF
ncbi:MAG: hypothetical protein ABIF08_00330 [Nanoarchaeota archaeon]